MGLVGYAGVSTREQDPAAQEWQLKAAGAERVFVDHGEASRLADRPQWLACKHYLRAGDTLVVPALDRLAGTTTLALQTITEVGERGINIRSLTEPDIDTTTPVGEPVRDRRGLRAAACDTVRQNTMLGLARARAEGRVGGRPTVMTPERIEQARRMRAEGKSFAGISRVLGIGATSVSRALG